MKTTYTPGPWKYHLGRGTNPRFHIQTEGGYQIASTTELATPKTAKHSSDFDENLAREANARLIAAAPALLSALRGVLACHGPVSTVAESAKALREAEAAIAAATGEGV